MKTRLLRVTAILGRLFLGVFFTLAGLSKIGMPLATLGTIYSYQIVLPDWFALAVAHTLPWIEIVLGLALITGLWPAVTLGWTSALLLVFTILTAQAWWRELPIDCGCLDLSAIHPALAILTSPGGATVRNLVLLTIAIFLAAHYQRTGPSKSERPSKMKMRTLWRVTLFPLSAIILAGLWSMRPTNDAFGDDREFPRVTWAEVEPHLANNSWVLVDAREEELFHAQHIPGAVSLPSHAYPELLEFFVEDHGTNKTVVIYCSTADCDLSTELARRLRDEAGLTNVRILDGGFLAWQRAQ